MLVSGCPEGQEYNTQLLYFTCSSMGKGDERIYMLSDRTGSPNVVVRSLSDGKERILTDNRKGILKS